MTTLRYKDRDHSYYSRLSDSAIVIGVVAIVIHLVVPIPVVILTIIAGLLITLTGLGLYFKTRVKDEPFEPARLG